MANLLCVLASGPFSSAPCHAATNCDKLSETVMKIRHRHHWVSPYHQHRFADKRDEQWTIRGLARELGVESGWVDNRIRNGFLRESDVSRKPPYGNVLIREDATLLARLRAEVKRSRRLRRTASTASSPSDAGKSLRPSVEGKSSVADCAMTSRTNRTLNGCLENFSRCRRGHRF